MAEHVATQSRFPWRTVVRTAFQIIVGAAPVVPAALEAVYQQDPGQLGGAAGVAVAISLAITRVMANPAVNEFLARWGVLRWLAAEPQPKG